MSGGLAWEKRRCQMLVEVVSAQLTEGSYGSWGREGSPMWLLPSSLNNWPGAEGTHLNTGAAMTLWSQIICIYLLQLSFCYNVSVKTSGNHPSSNAILSSYHAALVTSGGAHMYPQRVLLRACTDLLSLCPTFVLNIFTCFVQSAF